MLNHQDQENAKRQADELVRRYGQGVATTKVDAELASKPGNEYWEAVRQRVVADVPPGERVPIMGAMLGPTQGPVEGGGWIGSRLDGPPPRRF